MPGLNLITGNRLETLTDILGGIIAGRPLGSPMAPEIIIVQSNGMARWVMLQLAARHGVCANYRFPFPNAFVDDIAQLAGGAKIPEKSTDIDILTWQIMNLLNSAQGDPEFGVVRNYLKNDPGNIRLYQLSRHIADLFDQYAVYRPQMIAEWEGGRADNWQAILWTRLTGEGLFNHRAKQFREIFEKINDYTGPPEQWPERVQVFGISSLPNIYVQMLEAVSRLSEVNLFVMNPCREYWADILSDSEQKRLTRKLAGRSDSDQHIAGGNSLLASLGKQGRDFFYLLAEYGEQSYFDEPGEKTLLAAVQTDILDLRDRAKSGKSATDISPSDRTIQFHDCHGPAREIEVLYDNMLAMFDSDKDLLPSDILVMTPDIESYAPYIQAVFGNPESEAGRIPFTIADRGYASESRVIETFISILELAGSRCELSRILDILERDIVFRKFNLATGEIRIIAEWLKDVNVRWGYDRNHKQEMGLPEIHENTWRFGLDRLLSGYALTGTEETLYNGIFPYGNIEGESALTLGRFVEFAECLFNYLKLMSQEYDLDDWEEILSGLCRDLFKSDDDTEFELQTVRRSIGRLRLIKENSRFERKVGLEIIKQYLKDYLVSRGSGHGFIAGSVTFCAMLPMRSIPFKVICLVGLNGDSYPRQTKHLSFDLMAQNPQPGDRSARHTDRYIFLEAILSARQTLYLSFTGQSLQDNSPIPPSVLISELIDYIDQGFAIEGGPASDRLITRHSLQAFSGRYFRPGSSPWSFSTENCRAASALLNRSERAPVLFDIPLPEPENNFKKTDIDSFCRFFVGPPRYLLENRLGIRMAEMEAGREDDEPYTITGLSRYMIEYGLLKRHLKNGHPEAHRDLVRATGVLPHGVHGRIAYDKIANETAALAAKIEPFLSGEKAESLRIEFDADGYKIEGNLAELYPAHHLKYRPAAVKARDIIQAWIIGLLLSAAEDRDTGRASIFIGSDKIIKFAYLSGADVILKDLLKIYDSGLRRPLPIFPELSLGFAADIARGKDESAALNACLKAWRGGKFSRAERDDPYLKLCFSRGNPFNDEFRELALRIFTPILENMIVQQ